MKRMANGCREEFHSRWRASYDAERLGRAERAGHCAAEGPGRPAIGSGLGDAKSAVNRGGVAAGRVVKSAAGGGGCVAGCVGSTAANAGEITAGRVEESAADGGIGAGSGVAIPARDRGVFAADGVVVTRDDAAV